VTHYAAVTAEQGVQVLEQFPLDQGVGFSGGSEHLFAQFNRRYRFPLGKLSAYLADKGEESCRAL
jgi:hypothetical protein